MSNAAAVCAALVAGLSPHATERELAQKQLEEWEKNAGELALCLQSIATSQDTPPEIRQMAAVLLKNLVFKCWRGGIAEEHKAQLRVVLVEVAVRGDALVASQVAVALGRIARFDFPQRWPNLFAELVAQDRVPPPTTQTARVLTVLFCCLKELSQKRLRMDRDNYEKVAAHMLPTMSQYWEQYVTAAMSSPSSELVECTLLALRIMKRLAKFGLDDGNGVMGEKVKHANQVVGRLYALQLAQPNHVGVEALLYKHAVFVITMCREFPLGTVKCLGNSDGSGVLDTYHQIAVQGAVNKEGERMVPSQRTLIRVLLFLKDVHDNKGLATPQVDEMLFEHHEQCKHVAFIALAHCSVEPLLHSLINKYFVLNAEDLSLWEHDPEQFHQFNELDQQDTQLRPAAENLFLVVLRERREQAVPLLLQLLDQAVQITEAHPLQDWLLRDAVLLGVGIGHWTLANVNPQLLTSLFPTLQEHDLAVSDPARRSIVHRRVAWLIGEWSETLPAETHGLFFACLMQLLEDADLVVRLSATNSLRLLVNEVEFQAGTFANHLERAIRVLSELFVQVSQCQQLVMSTLGDLLLVMSDAVAPHAPLLMAELARAWEASEPSVRLAVITAVARVACACKPLPPAVLEVALPIVAYATNPANAEALLLLVEDGLLLWLSLLRNAASVQHLDAMFPVLPVLVARDFDGLLLCYLVVQEYMLVGSAEFVHAQREAVVGVLCQNSPLAMKDRSAIVVLGVVDTLMLLWRVHNCSLHGLDAVMRPLLRAVLLGDGEDGGALAALRAHRRDTASALMRTHFACALCRLLIVHTEAAVALLSTSGEPLGLGAGNHDVTPLFAQRCLELFDALGTALQRVVVAAALSFLLGAHPSGMRGAFADVVRVVGGTLPEARNDDFAAKKGVGVHDDLPPLEVDDAVFVLDGGNIQPPPCARKEQLYLQHDPLAGCDLAQCLKAGVQGFCAKEGEGPTAQALAALDPSTRQLLVQHGVVGG